MFREREKIISYKLDAFEGPLDLLLHLIEKNKIDIYDIPIVQITEQYLEYVNRLEEEDLEIISDFLIMAVTLLEIKAKMLLPAKEEEEEEGDVREELVQRLLEYKKYKEMGKLLHKKEEEHTERVQYSGRSGAVQSSPGYRLSLKGNRSSQASGNHAGNCSAKRRQKRYAPFQFWKDQAGENQLTGKNQGCTRLCQGSWAFLLPSNASQC